MENQIRRVPRLRKAVGMPHLESMARCLLLLASLTASSQARGGEYAPRVLSPSNADAYSMKTFANYQRWRDLKGDARAWEVFAYLADPRTGLFPLGKEVLEGRDVLPEFQTVRDPVKLINVYGYGYCGILGPTMAGICQDMGLGRARTLILPGWSHVVAETYYNDRWHYLDLDVRAAFRRRDGSLASMADAQKDASLWNGPQGPLFFPLDPLDQVRAIYAQTPVRHYYGYHFSGHTMDYVLRQGETFTRWWQPQGGRWHHLDTYHQDPFFKRLFEQSPRGPKCKHAGWTVHSHGNGRFLYKPNLTDQSSDFTDGAYDAQNVRPGATGLTLQAPGQGYAIFEVRWPYVIVPLVGNMQTRADDREASVVQLDAKGATLALSLDNGITWKDLGDPHGTLDLTPYVSGRYGYLLKVSLKGRAGEAVVRSLVMTTWVQVAPAALPSLRKGKNRMEYRTGDHYGLASRVLEINSNGSDQADFFKYLSEAPKDFDASRTAGRARGPFVVKVQAPPSSKIAWFSAGGAFATHQQGGARDTRNASLMRSTHPKASSRSTRRMSRPIKTTGTTKPTGRSNWSGPSKPSTYATWAIRVSITCASMPIAWTTARMPVRPWSSRTPGSKTACARSRRSRAPSPGHTKSPRPPTRWTSPSRLRSPVRVRRSRRRSLFRWLWRGLEAAPQRVDRATTGAIATTGDRRVRRGFIVALGVFARYAGRSPADLRTTLARLLNPRGSLQGGFFK